MRNDKNERNYTERLRKEVKGSLRPCRKVREGPTDRKHGLGNVGEVYGRVRLTRRHERGKGEARGHYRNGSCLG